MNKLLETKWFDIKDTVFEGETEAIMYVTEDIYDDSYIIAIPVITLSVQIWNKYDYDYLINSNVLASNEKRKRLVKEIKKAISEF